MEIVVVAVRDQKADAFGNPWYAQTKGMALRHFGDAVNTQDANNLWAKHPDDFALFELGTYNTQDGTFKLLPRPVQLGLASDFINQR